MNVPSAFHEANMEHCAYSTSKERSISPQNARNEGLDFKTLGHVFQHDVDEVASIQGGVRTHERQRKENKGAIKVLHTKFRVALSVRNRVDLELIETHKRHQPTSDRFLGR